MSMSRQEARDLYYLGIAEAVGSKSSCMRRLYGAVIVKNDEIISTGYNGAPRGALNCNELGCVREAFGTKKGDAYNLCGSVHAEQNAMISAPRRDMIGATIYIVGVNVARLQNLNSKMPHYADPSPCSLCHRMLINAGIVRAVGLIEDPNVPDMKKMIEMDISGATLMNKIQQEYYALLERQTLEFKAAMASHPEDMTPREQDRELTRLSKIKKLIDMRQLMLDGRGNEIDMAEAHALMHHLEEGDYE